MSDAEPNVWELRTKAIAYTGVVWLVALFAIVLNVVRDKPLEANALTYAIGALLIGIVLYATAKAVQSWLAVVKSGDTNG